MSEALKHVLRKPFIDAKKLRFCVLVSTLKYLPPSTYILKYLIVVAHKTSIPDRNNVDTFISYLGPMTRECDLLLLKFMPRKLPSTLHKSNVCCYSGTDEN